MHAGAAEAHVSQEINFPGQAHYICGHENARPVVFLSRSSSVLTQLKSGAYARAQKTSRRPSQTTSTFLDYRRVWVKLKRGEGEFI